ncbi:TlpA family protein disulfide reductase [Aquipuribacter hungaricus]|uniref:TlpA family protein disulfide reductase n=1 Tax=Aquipuribacter hungaricus TaxID=545624 RepID=A0ABV7WLI8_9MICO
MSQPVTEYKVGDRGAPVYLSGATLTDDELDLASLRGEVVVVNVWGSWCGPCRVEAPVLSRVSTDYRERGVSFVGVNVKDNRAAAVAFEEEHGITYPSIEDTDGRAVLALSQYVPASAVPVTLVLDRDGRVAARVLGAVREATVTALLDGTLAEAL